MNSITKTTAMKHKQAIFSTLWIFAMLNYLYCDVISLMDSGFLKQFLTGNVGGMHVTQGFLFGAAVLMEIPTAMVLLSRVLERKANRWANIIAGTIMTVVQSSTLFFGSSPTLYYLFFSTLEITCTAFIVGFAWRWADTEEHIESNVTASANVA